MSDEKSATSTVAPGSRKGISGRGRARAPGASVALVCGAPRRGSGEPCQANPTADGKCYWHSSRYTEEARVAACAQGGYIATRSRVLPAITTPASLASEEDARTLLQETIDAVRTGKMSPNIGNAVGYLVSIGLRLAELKLSAQIAALEAELARDDR